ncbi:inovirus-type Gp2 protein [Acinetobacter sp. YH12255]|uniref:YagK/YfjJ domain-containing protein n=1 Tax=Acinetobacter sp. YH12255 TaxID=2601179 RepID=UPI0015D37D19|nr:inovirus-type Gp2 protein [Acinetobacter sp. YH12255]
MNILYANAGRYMGTHEQWLQQFETELQTTPVNDGDKTTFVVNSLDNILAPAIGKAKLVKQFKKHNFPEVIVGAKKLSNSRYTFSTKYPAHMSNLPSDIEELINYSSHSDIINGLDIQAFDDALSQMSEDELELLRNSTPPPSSLKENLLPYINAVNKFSGLIGSFFRRPDIRRKVYDERKNLKNNKSRMIKMFNSLIERYSRVVVVRLDLYFKNKSETLLQNCFTAEDCLSKNDFDAFKKRVEQLLENKRHNPVLKQAIGYIFRFEYTPRRGFHLHTFWFFNGNKNQEDISLAEGIEQLWKKVTNDQGYAYICNKRKHTYENCYLGTIEYNQSEKRKWLEDGFDYLCKTSQLFIFTNMKNGRRFQISQPLQPQTRGRPRSKPLDLNSVTGDEA